jgi:hypothetical protein
MAGKSPRFDVRCAANSIPDPPNRIDLASVTRRNPTAERISAKSFVLPAEKQHPAAAFLSAAPCPRALCQGLGRRFCEASNGLVGGAQRYHLTQAPVVLERSKFPIHVLGPGRGGALPKDRHGGIMALVGAAVASVRSPRIWIGIGRLKPNLTTCTLFGPAK